MMKRILSVGILTVIVILLSGCSKSDRFYRSGRKCFNSGNYEEAAQYFTQAIQENPNKADYYIDLGMAFIGQSKYDEALAQFDRIIMDKNISIVKENNKKALRGKGIAYFYMKDYTEAINQFDQALNISKSSDLDMDILCYKGKALMNTGNYKEAAETYTKIIERFGEDAQILADRAYTYQKIGNYEEGLKDYDKAIELTKNKYEYYFGKYYLLQEMNKTDEAMEVLKRAEALEVKTKEDKYNLAKIHFYQELYDQALTELSESFANGFTEAYFYIGEIYSRKKDYSTAKYYYEKYMEAGGAVTAPIYNEIASCLIKTGEYEQAINYLDMGLKASYDDTKRVLLKNQIIAYENIGDFENALNKIESYTDEFPEDEEAIREKLFLLSRKIEADN